MKLRKVEREIRIDVEKVNECIYCGSCSSLCPITIAGYDHNKRLFKLVTIGSREALEVDIPWLCNACGCCAEVCPKKIDSREVYFAIRRLQVEKLRVPESFLNELREIYAQGELHASSSSKERRKALGLHKSSEKMVEEVRKIISMSKIAKLGII